MATKSTFGARVEATDLSDASVAKMNQQVDEKSDGPARDAHIANLQTFKVRSKDEALVLIDKLKKGEIKPEHQQMVMKGVQEFGVHMAQIREAAKGENGGVIDNTGDGSDTGTYMAQVWNRTVGMGAVGLTILSSAVAEPLAGLAGGVTLLAGQGNDQATDVINAWRDALTLDPLTDEGTVILESVAAPLKKIDDGADWVATKLGRGNPYAEWAIYSTLIAAPELLGLKGASALKRGAGAGNKVARAEARANRLGVSLKQTELPGSVIDAAAKMTPDIRSASIGKLQEAMLLAEKKARTAKQKAAGRARATEAATAKGGVDDMASAVRQEMKDAYDLEGLPTLTKRLDELDKVGKGPNPKDSRLIVPEGARSVDPMDVTLDSLNNISSRIERTLLKRGEGGGKSMPATLDESAALRSLQKTVDDFIGQQFNKDLISGDPKAVARWKRSNKLRRDYDKKFTADKTIRQFVDAENTPQQLSRWLLGTNAAKAKPNAVAVINRMKEILGPDHAAIKGIKMEITTDLMAPLLQNKPNFGTFVQRVDDFVKLNKGDGGLIKSLDFDMGDINAMRGFALAATRLPVPVSWMSVQGFVKNASRMIWGHGIAKAGVKVNIGSNVLGMVGRTDKLSRKAMLFNVAEAQFGGPVVPRSSIAAGRVISRVVRSDIETMERQGK